MFYSHDILTSRRHGVATVWLVATLGSKSSLKKVSRRAILDVNVPKACETISDPESPMALRLQSSLLYGVSRVFSQQCGYIWTDVQSLHDKMRGISLVIRDLQIDSGVAQTSNDQLNLPSDPGFNLDLDLGLDLSALDLSPKMSEKSSLLSPCSLTSTQSSLLLAEESEMRFELPLTGTPDDNFLNFDLDAGIATSSAYNPVLFTESVLDEPGIDENPLFDIDDDGGIIDRPPNASAAGDVTSPNIGRDFDNDSAIEARVASEHAALADIQGGANAYDDDGLVLMGDDDIELSDQVQPATSLQIATADDPEQALPPATTSERGGEIHASSETAEAPQRRTKVARPLQADVITELSNRQLSEWQADYMDNMAKARLEKANRQSWTQARRNAAFWMLDQGIGRAMTNFGNDREPHPLTIFCGQSLLDALTGSHYSLAGTKRSHNLVDDEADEEEGDARRIRSGTEENVGRGHNEVIAGDIDDDMLFQDDDEVESQIGRHLASSLKDHPSSMPWNLMGSSQPGSVRGSAQPGRSSSARGIGFDIGQPSIISGRRSRLTSASPLYGRGLQPSRILSLDPQLNDLSFEDDFADPNAALPSNMNEDFELYGPAGAVGTQQAAQSQWLNATLEKEAHNFLLFLDEKLDWDARDGNAMPTITFEQLLSPETNSNIIAAQGILHVLGLATKGLIVVQQDEAFGDIILSTNKSRVGNGEIEDEDEDEQVSTDEEMVEEIDD